MAATERKKSDVDVGAEVLETELASARRRQLDARVSKQRALRNLEDANVEITWVDERVKLLESAIKKLKL